jgi:hypothetical protein
MNNRIAKLEKMMVETVNDLEWYFNNTTDNAILDEVIKDNEEHYNWIKQRIAWEEIFNSRASFKKYKGV